MLVHYPLDGEDCDNQKQNLNSSGEPYVNEDRYGAMKVSEMDGDPKVNMVMGMDQVMEKVMETQVMVQATRIETEQTEYQLAKQ